MTTHIWQEYLDLVEQLRRTERGKEIYAMRKETIERVFADAKEKHAMRYTHHRGLARVTSWVRLKYAAMNLKKLAEWSWNNSFFHLIASLFLLFMLKSPLSPNENRDFFDKLKKPARIERCGLVFLVWSFPRGIHPGGSERSAGCMCIRAVGAIQRFPAAAALPSGLPALRRCGTGGRTFQNRHSALPAFFRIPVPWRRRGSAGSTFLYTALCRRP